MCEEAISLSAAFLCAVPCKRLRNFITLKTQARIRTFELLSYTHWCINIGTMYASTKLFICTDLYLLHACIFNFPGSISNVSSQEHLATVLHVGLITCWFCFIKTLSHTKLLAILHKSKFYLDDCVHARCRFIAVLHLFSFQCMMF